MEGNACKGNHGGGGLMEEEPGKRNHGGGTTKEDSWRKDKEGRTSEEAPVSIRGYLGGI